MLVLLAGSLVGGVAQDQPPAGNAVAPPVAGRSLREIRVRIAADEEFRRRENWKTDAAKRLELASAVYEREFAIRWRLFDVVEWTSDDAAPTLEDLHAQLTRDVAPGDADLVVGLTDQAHARGDASTYRRYGLGQHFGRFALCGARQEATPDGWDTLGVCHELAHVLGAWHSADPASVMATNSAIRPIVFDPVTRETLEVTREFDFRAGVAWLDEARTQRLVALYRRGHGGGDCWFSPGAAWLGVAMRGTSTSPVSWRETFEALRRAGDLFAAAESSQAALAYGCRLGASQWALQHDDVESALPLAEAAADSARVDPRVETTIGEANEQLAYVLGRSGQPGRARSLLQEVLAARRRTLGPRSDETRRVAAALGVPADTWSFAAQDLVANERHRVRRLAWVDDGRSHSIVVADATDAIGEVVAPDATFAKPQPDTLHVRRVPSAELSTSWRLGDEYEGDVFEVATSGRGTFTLVVVDELKASVTKSPSVERYQCVGDDARSDGSYRSFVGVFVRRRPGSGSGWNLGYAADILVGSGEPDTEPTRISTTLYGPPDGAAARFRPGATGGSCLRWSGGALPLATWRWVSRTSSPAPSVNAAFDSDDVSIDGQVAHPSDAAKWPGWRVELEFTPAPVRSEPR